VHKTTTVPNGGQVFPSTAVGSASTRCVEWRLEPGSRGTSLTPFQTPIQPPTIICNGSLPPLQTASEAIFEILWTRHLFLKNREKNI
jgi:hypothetical protein